MLIFLDYFFTIFHTALVLFVLTGWIFPKTRKAHGILLIAVLVAWLGIGFYKGVLGYCPLTAWHWDVKRALGENTMPSSFIEYMVEKVSGIDFDRKLVDICTAVGLIASIVMAVIMYWREKLLTQRQQNA